ncbi:isochorismatase family cysteine hydrolase [Hydrogenoanaerobacterium sp.]|uniref:cysteine hydrolase family protein n=1 Tax=Hydrogenoanaerobacterium sp. TaxID=2953763 RepID=UPI00289BA047|nr:isochorismatase family cysteine hydrolase [Hydrogenoanaerobacterium sp.]
MNRKKLLVVVDYQNDFVDGALGFPKAEQLEDAICAKIDTAHANGDDIVFTLDTHLADYLYTQEGKNLPVTHCVKGTAGWELYGKIKELAVGHPQLEKNTFGCKVLFDYLLTAPTYDEIELAGLVSNICVISNAVIAKTAQPEAAIVVDSNCTACFDPELHEKTLDVMEGLQIKVLNRD